MVGLLLLIALGWIGIQERGSCSELELEHYSVQCRPSSGGKGVVFKSISRWGRCFDGSESMLYIPYVGGEGTKGDKSPIRKGVFITQARFDLVLFVTDPMIRERQMGAPIRKTKTVGDATGGRGCEV